MTNGTTARLAVLGSPISHSKSPALHRAAYAALGLDWAYDSFEMTGDALPAFLDGLGTEWRGLSLTMPVKRDVLPLLDTRDELVTLTGVANTLVFDEGRRLGFNTDVYGIIAAFGDHGITSIDHVHLLGGGATAASAIVAASRLGASRVTISVRSPQRSLGLLDLARAVRLQVDLEQLGDPPLGIPDAVISTIPNGVNVEGLLFDEHLRAGSVLFDAAYEPWPSGLAAQWNQVGGTVISGLEMLLNQAVMQVRLFAGGDAERALDDELVVVAAMRASVGLPPADVSAARR